MPDTQISEEMVERAAAAIRELTGPYLGTPEQIAKHGERIRLRQEESARKFARAALEAALSGHVVGWRTMDSAPKDGTWILIADDHCWPPDLVRWQPERPRRTINGNNHLAIPAGWFGSPGGRSRFDVPDGHLMKATRWQPLPVSEMEG